MTTIAIVGGAFRAQLFVRIAAALPDRFEVTGVMSRTESRRDEIRRRWGVPVVDSLDALGRPDFVVVAVPPTAAVSVIRRLVEAGHPVLTETPAAPDVPSLLELQALVDAGATIQVAEQYHLEPLIQAQIAIARSGILGTVDDATVSVAHDYHGISVLRRMLALGFDDATITAHRRSAPVQAGPTRAGDPERDELIDSVRTTARLDFGDRVGTFDFDDQQYRSFVRSSSVLLRGPRGELRDTEVSYLADYRTPVRQSISRIAAGVAGNHEGMFLRSLSLGDRLLYRNEFLPARLADDELAVATLLERMALHAAGGAPVYSLAEAAQDQYLQLMVREAAASGTSVRTARQSWASTVIHT